MAQKTVLMVVGSFRKNSFNQSIANYIAEILKEKVNVDFINYRGIPLLEQDSEFPTPSEITSIRRQVEKADALWVVSPEYNGSYPASLKNLLDWLSRPEKPADFQTPTVINGKPATVSGIAGSTAAKFVRKNLSELLSYIRMKPMNESGTGLIIPAEAWATGILVLTDEHKQLLRMQIDEFLKFIGA